MSAVKQLNEAMNHFHLGAEAGLIDPNHCRHGTHRSEICRYCEIEIWQTDGVVRKDPLQSQEGGDHYRKLKIQPMEYSMANGLDACQHTVIKYVTRFRDKGGIQDLRKAIHTIELLIELEGRK